VARTPANLIIGATGAGKTTAILRLLAARPAGEQWSVLVNDFGAIKLHTAPAATGQSVSVREVAGCICCTGQVALRTALVTLLRGSKPQRLLIEASAAADPHALLELLHEPGIAQALELRKTICVIDPEQAAEVHYSGNEVYQEQVAAADVVYISKRDITTASARVAARDRVQAMHGTPTVVLDATGLDSKVLD